MRCSAGAVRQGAWHAHDAILEMLNLHEHGRERLGTGAEGPFNATEKPQPPNASQTDSPGDGMPSP